MKMWLVIAALVCTIGNQAIQADDKSESAKVSGSSVSYMPESPKVKGHFAVPAGEGPFPGLVVIHEWWGLNQQIKDEVERLAAEGYAALAVDLYEGSVATTPNEARAAMKKVTAEGSLSNLNGAVAYLQGLDSVDKDRTGCIGWCFGGGKSLQLGIHNPAIDAMVIYYGQLVNDPEVLKGIRGVVLGQFGADDGHPSPEQVAAFRVGLEAAGTANEIYSYEGASHAFANPTGTRYNKAAAEKAWNRTVSFLKTHLKTPAAKKKE